jgi:hypothetical protein
MDSHTEDKVTVNRDPTIIEEVGYFLIVAKAKRMEITGLCMSPRKYLQFRFEMEKQPRLRTDAIKYQIYDIPFFVADIEGIKLMYSPSEAARMEWEKQNNKEL